MSSSRRNICLAFCVLPIFGPYLAGGAASQNRSIDERQVRSVLNQLQTRGEDWSDAEKEYILKNINREQILSVISKWESDKKIIITPQAKITILIDYLLTELAGMKALSTHLDDVGTEKSYSLSERWKSEIAGNLLRRNEYGHLKITSNPDNVEVYIDNDFIEYSNKEFVLLQGTHDLVLKKEGYEDFAKSVYIERNKIHNFECQLKTK